MACSWFLVFIEDGIGKQKALSRICQDTTAFRINAQTLDGKRSAKNPNAD